MPFMRKLHPFGTFYRQAHLRSISIFSDRVSPLPWFITAFDGTSLYSAQDLPQIDVLLITHDHYDHLDYPTILAIDPLVTPRTPLPAANPGKIGPHYRINV